MTVGGRREARRGSKDVDNNEKKSRELERKKKEKRQNDEIPNYTLQWKCQKQEEKDRKRMII